MIMVSSDPSLIFRLKKQRQAFAYGIHGVDTLFNTGMDGANPLKQLRTQITDETVRVGWHLPRVKMNRNLERTTVNMLAAQLVIVAGDAIEKNSSVAWRDNSIPDIQFLRQIRNGAAHNNRLEFKRDSDPVSPTAWEGYEITESMEGELIFTIPKYPLVYSESVEMNEGFFGAGDAFALVSDVIEMLESRMNTQISPDLVQKWICEALISLHGASIEEIRDLLDLRAWSFSEDRIQAELDKLEQKGHVDRIDSGDTAEYQLLAE